MVFATPPPPSPPAVVRAWSKGPERERQQGGGGALRTRRRAHPRRRRAADAEAGARVEPIAPLRREDPQPDAKRQPRPRDVPAQGAAEAHVRRPRPEGGGCD